MVIVESEQTENPVQLDIKPDITFAYIHVDYGNKDINQSLIYFKYSVVHLYPKDAFATVVIKAPLEQLMRSRVLCYNKMREDIKGNMIHLDVDIIAYNKLPKEFWDQDFDIALTTSQHSYSLMPYNEGIIFSKDTPAAHKFFNDYADFVRNVPAGMMDSHVKDWWIGQLALNMAYYKSAASKEVKFLILDDKKFNFTPDGPVGTDAYFVHFKGDRKHLMKQYLCGLIGTDYIHG